MMKKRMIMSLALCMMLGTSVCALAEEAGTAPKPRIIATSDGVLSIEAPSDAWEVMQDPNHWFTLTDGNDTITIEHLSNGESLPASAVADETYSAVYQALVSTRNEVFVIKGCAVNAEDLEPIMNAIGTIKILRVDTKTAVKQEVVAVPSVTVTPVDKICYVIGDEVNVRLGCSVDDQAIGAKYYGEEVHVTGTVQKDGADLGWSQISFNNTTAYISSAFLSDAKPQSTSSSAGTASTTPAKSTGSSNNGNYAIEPPNGTQDPYAPGQSYCIYCGRYYPEGPEFWNHYCPAKEAAIASGDEAIDSVNGTQDPSAPGQAYCIYCGQYYPEGNIFRNHVCPRRDEANAGYAIEPLDGTQDPFAVN